jgi:hypothetical protein
MCTYIILRIYPLNPITVAASTEGILTYQTKSQLASSKPHSYQKLNSYLHNSRQDNGNNNNDGFGATGGTGVGFAGTAGDGGGDGGGGIGGFAAPVAGVGGVLAAIGGVILAIILIPLILLFLLGLLILPFTPLLLLLLLLIPGSGAPVKFIFGEPPGNGVFPRSIFLDEATVIEDFSRLLQRVFKALDRNGYLCGDIISCQSPAQNEIGGRKRNASESSSEKPKWVRR